MSYKKVGSFQDKGFSEHNRKLTFIATDSALFDGLLLYFSKTINSKIHQYIPHKSTYLFINWSCM